MAFDGIFCKAVANELNQWAGARVEKIYQSSPSCMYFQIYKDGLHKNLIVSASASKPVLAVCDDAVARPDTPTPLCMLYRKHIANGKLAEAYWLEDERIIRLAFDHADDLGYVRRVFVYAEMMGKYSNLLLTDADNRILGASSVTDITSGVRHILPGVVYELPPKQEKASVFSVDKAAFLALCREKTGMKICDFLLRSFLALSPAITRELAFLACGSVDATLLESNAEVLYSVFEAFVKRISRNEFSPTAVYSGDGIGVEYAFIPLLQYGHGFETRTYQSFSALLADFFDRKEEAVNLDRYSKALLHTANTNLARLRRKLCLLQKERADCDAMEEMRKAGDLITANIYRIRQGDESVTALDYETGLDATVGLAVNLTPARNAQRYYKKYAKMKRAVIALDGQIAQANAEADYLTGVVGFIERAADPQELAEIRLELCDGGYINDRDSKKSNKKKTPASKPLSFTTSSGRPVFVGRNNRQNDALTGNADRSDIWFHIKGFHGSHVILSSNGDEPDSADYTEAAMLAAYYSEKRGSPNVSVDYTRVRNLKKPSGSAPGFVTYDKYFTAVVNGDNPFGRIKQ